MTSGDEAKKIRGLDLDQQFFFPAPPDTASRAAPLLSKSTEENISL
jgi:hypothetical protein